MTRTPRQPRVALVSWHTSPLAAPGAGRAGGMNVYVGALARGLHRRGIAVDIITGHPAPTLRTLAPGLRLLGLPGGRLDPDAQGLPRYDIVHSHYWQSAAVAGALVRRGGARHVHTFHTLGEVKNGTRAPGDAPEPPSRLAAERAIVGVADAVVVATAVERGQLVDGLGGTPASIHVVAPGVDCDRFTPAAGATAAAVRAALGVAPGDALAVHIGRIQPLKGIDLALRALALTGRRCVLALAGGPSGPAGATTLGALRRQAQRLGPDVSLRVLGRVEQRTLAPLIAAADVAVVGSRSESFCLAALEAQACATPVVGTAVGGLPELAGDGGGGRVVARTVQAFAAGLGDVLGAEGARRRDLRAGALASARRYGWDATAAGVAAAYGL